MTQNDNGSYGIQWPRWYVYWRGRMWLSGKYGCCPNCYSSPPNPDCFICGGDYFYGRRMYPETKYCWLRRWDDWYDKKRHLIQDSLLFVTLIVLSVIGVASMIGWLL